MAEQLKDYVRYQLRLCGEDIYSVREKELFFHNAFGAVELYLMVNSDDEEIRDYWSSVKDLFVQRITFIR